jgi:hypothetical protein
LVEHITLFLRQSSRAVKRFLRSIYVAGAPGGRFELFDGTFLESQVAEGGADLQDRLRGRRCR